jgi:hypothetical protein
MYRQAILEHVDLGDVGDNRNHGRQVTLCYTAYRQCWVLASLSSWVIIFCGAHTELKRGNIIISGNFFRLFITMDRIQSQGSTCRICGA